MADMLSQSSGNGTAPRILPASEMSASQRNQTFDATIHQLNLVITQVNALTNNAMQQETDIARVRDYLEGRINDQQDQIRRLREFQQRSFWQRLHWLVTGR